MAKQLDLVSGAVRQVNQKGNGIQVAGFDGWLNVSQYHPVKPMPTIGELVEVQFEQTDRGAWITSLTIIGAAPSGTPSPSSDPDRQIRRQVAMKTAAQLVSAFAQTHAEVRVDHVFPLADKILEWLEQTN